MKMRSKGKNVIKLQPGYKPRVTGSGGLQVVQIGCKTELLQHLLFHPRDENWKHSELLQVRFYWQIDRFLRKHTSCYTTAVNVLADSTTPRTGEASYFFLWFASGICSWWDYYKNVMFCLHQ